MAAGGAPSVPLTVVSAAAGSGKTTAVRSWTDGLARVWLTCGDERHGLELAGRLLRQLRVRLPEMPAELAIAFGASAGPGVGADPVERAEQLGALIADALAESLRQPLTIVIDDLERNRRRDRTDPDDRVARTWRSTAAADRARHAYVRSVLDRSSPSRRCRPRGRWRIAATRPPIRRHRRPRPMARRRIAHRGRRDARQRSPGDARDDGSRGAARRRGGARRTARRHRSTRPTRGSITSQLPSSPPSIPPSDGSSTMRSSSATPAAPSWRRWAMASSSALIAELVADHLLDQRVGEVDSVHVSRAIAGLLATGLRPPASRRRVRRTVSVGPRRSDPQPADRGQSRHRRAGRRGARRHRPRRRGRRRAEPRARRHPPTSRWRGITTRQPRRPRRPGTRRVGRRHRPLPGGGLEWVEQCGRRVAPRPDAAPARRHPVGDRGVRPGRRRTGRRSIRPGAARRLPRCRSLADRRSADRPSTRRGRPDIGRSIERRSSTGVGLHARRDGGGRRRRSHRQRLELRQGAAARRARGRSAAGGPHPLEPWIAAPRGGRLPGRPRRARHRRASRRSRRLRSSARPRTVEPR